MHDSTPHEDRSAGHLSPDFAGELEALRSDLVAGTLTPPARLLVALYRVRRECPGPWSEAFAIVGEQRRTVREMTAALLRVVDRLDTRQVWPGSPDARRELKKRAARAPDGVTATDVLRNMLPDAALDVGRHMFRPQHFRLGSWWVINQYGDRLEYVPGHMLLYTPYHTSDPALWVSFWRWFTKEVRNAVELRLSPDEVVPLEPDMSEDAHTVAVSLDAVNVETGTAFHDLVPTEGRKVLDLLADTGDACAFLARLEDECSNLEWEAVDRMAPRIFEGFTVLEAAEQAAAESARVEDQDAFRDAWYRAKRKAEDLRRAS